MVGQQTASFTQRFGLASASPPEDFTALARTALLHILDRLEQKH